MNQAGVPGYPSSEPLPEPLRQVALATHQVALRRLLRLLARPHKFQLILLQYADPAYRATLAQALSETTAGTLWTLDAKRLGRFAEFEAILAEKAAQASSVQILGLEMWPIAGGDDLFKGFNYHREAIAALGCTLMLWLTEKDIQSFALEAPDMWAWRTAVLDLSAEATHTALMLATEPAMGLSPARLDEIRRYLEDARDPAPSLVLSLIGGLVEADRLAEARTVMAQWRDFLLSDDQPHHIRLTALRASANLARKEGAFKDALSLLEQAQALCEGDGDRVGLAECYGDRAWVLADWDKVAEALALLEVQHDLLVTIGNRLLLGKNYGNRALLLERMGRLTDAELCFRVALENDEMSLGPKQPDIARDLDNLARVLKATGRLGEAEQLLRRALAITEGAFGSDHPYVARSLNSLAILLLGTEQPAEAELLLRRALATQEAALGPDQPDVAMYLNNLAISLVKTQRPAEAEPLLRRAFDIFSASLGPEHPVTLNVLRKWESVHSH